MTAPDITAARAQRSWAADFLARELREGPCGGPAAASRGDNRSSVVDSGRRKAESINNIDVPPRRASLDTGLRAYHSSVIYHIHDVHHDMRRPCGHRHASADQCARCDGGGAPGPRGPSRHRRTDALSRCTCRVASCGRQGALTGIRGSRTGTHEKPPGGVPCRGKATALPLGTKWICLIYRWPPAALPMRRA